MDMKFRTNIYAATIYQFLAALFLCWLTRFVFIFYNWDSVGISGFGESMRLSFDGLRFDLSAVAYFNVLFIAMRVLPFRFAASRAWLRATGVVYFVTNALLLAINLGDTPYYRFTGSRLRWSSFMDMTADPNWFGVTLSYAVDYWWVFIAVGLFAAALMWLYCRVEIFPPPKNTASGSAESPLGRYALRTLVFLLFAAAAVYSMRGRIGNGVPLSIADAGWYIDSPQQINAVLNSPFCILRSLNKHNELEPMVFFSDEELAGIRTSLHRGSPAGPTGRNVMIITIESGGSVWYDSLCAIPNDDFWGLIPFLDSLASQSLVCRNTITTGRRSVEGITAVYGGFPTFTPFTYMLSPYNNNTLDSPARLLRDEGYSTVFYFGCNHGSFNIDQMAHASGFERVVDREAYGDESEFDGHWGIFDHAMGEYAALDLSRVREPFFAGWFTLNAHNPYTKPEHWRPDGYRHPEPSPERGMEYTDRAVRRFFELASQQPWYRNTIFIITADHGSRDLKDTVYDTPYIKYHIPFILYTPDGSIAPGAIDDRMMSQFDIAPTVLGLLNYPHDYVALGTDLFDAETERYAIGFVDNQYRVTGLRYLVQLTPDASQIASVYDIAADPYMTAPVEEYDVAEVGRMKRWAQAFLQDYTSRMIGDRMSAVNE